MAKALPTKAAALKYGTAEKAEDLALIHQYGEAQGANASGAWAGALLRLSRSKANFAEAREAAKDGYMAKRRSALGKKPGAVLRKAWDASFRSLWRHALKTAGIASATPKKKKAGASHATDKPEADAPKPEAAKVAFASDGKVNVRQDHFKNSAEGDAFATQYAAFLLASVDANMKVLSGDGVLRGLANVVRDYMRTAIKDAVVIKKAA